MKEKNKKEKQNKTRKDQKCKHEKKKNRQHHSRKKKNRDRQNLRMKIQRSPYESGIVPVKVLGWTENKTAESKKQNTKEKKKIIYIYSYRIEKKGNIVEATKNNRNKEEGRKGEKKTK